MTQAGQQMRRIYYVVAAFVQQWTSPSTPEVAITID